MPTARPEIYHIVAINGPRARDSQPLETLGVYDPTPRRIAVLPEHSRSLLTEGTEPRTQYIKRVKWDRSRVKHWLGVGAQPSKRLAWLLHKVCASYWRPLCTLPLHEELMCSATIQENLSAFKVFFGFHIALRLTQCLSLLSTPREGFPRVRRSVNIESQTSSKAETTRCG